MFRQDAEVLKVFFVLSWSDEGEAISLWEEGFELLSNLVLMIRTLN